jgi:hypothetical protein
VFQNLRVRSLSLDWLEITWEVANTTLDPHDFAWVLERSESPSGPWDPLAGPFSDRYRFIDSRVNLLNRWRQLYYRIQSTQKADSQNIEYSDPVTQAADIDLIGAEIQMLERTVLREFNGRMCWVFPARTFGQYCPHCMDAGKGGTMRKLRSGCPTCYDRNYARGYMDPIELWVQFDPSPKADQQIQTGNTQQVNTTARLVNYPLIKPDDVIVEMENRRWRVTRVSMTERLRAVVHQELTLHEIVKGDIEFQLPINISDLMAVEPSPERNFSNPQNLESATSEEDILAILKAYGYRHG